MSRILLGVSGGIAAYKACTLLRALSEAGHDVTVVPTENALRFVGAATWEALSGKPVTASTYDDVDRVPHVRLGRAAELVVVAPATADLLARAAQGRADDLLTNCLLTATCPVLFAPAMHTEMWRHPATVANVATLRSRGAVVLDPDDGRLTGADSGPGRLPEPAEIAAVAATLLERPGLAERAAARDLAGLRVAVSAGGTREHLDPVRFLGNASSGLMGWALARAALLRGAEVELVAANVERPAPGTARLTTVTSTRDLEQAMRTVAADADVVVMAAAPADFAPREYAAAKIKKESPQQGLELSLVQNPDVLAGLVAERDRREVTRQVLVGFAAETADDPAALRALGVAKLARKGCDLLVLNAVGRGKVFGKADSEITLLSRPDGPEGETAADGPHAGTKDALAHLIWDAALAVRSGR
ncbi:phosphopantothenoylcysteine decarboxylase/phosphopantothenate--cysteine ligase [Friedmanniella endophytica]|uniref:Coenzyme A biosynthesis bifunctional protein CoaBC n=1 Tax=Microlunatus kandeliicorticis TaxID=1759536 RepID=A0A7W3ITW5_9ACTN|nr:bifunctional phosphopantothenoylcysteine decarboxylase/phosphopantothenate--cysteine ligase CoaBC [Microlunatus kandeliicorticis]MBA8795085.1 phosphopantothenoylcysteine decarboxylase/phosphopantothenate--cysteine ligase [Microlunatus kandeliicorticis]